MTSESSNIYSMHETKKVEIWDDIIDATALDTEPIQYTVSVFGWF